MNGILSIQELKFGNVYLIPITRVILQSQRSLRTYMYDRIKLKQHPFLIYNQQQMVTGTRQQTNTMYRKSVIVNE